MNNKKKKKNKQRKRKNSFGQIKKLALSANKYHP